MNIRLFKNITFKLNGFVFLLSLLVFALLIKLGLWQLDRAFEKELRLQKMQTYQQQTALKLNDILTLSTQSKTHPAVSENINDLPVRLSGVFNNTQVLLLDNQTHKGRLGYRVIKAFQDEKSKLHVLVNLGWIQGKVDRSYIPDIDDVVGRVTFNGKIRVIEPSIVLVDEVLQSENWPQRVQSIEINKLSKLLAQPLLPFMVYVDNEDPLGYVKEWVPIVMPPAKHRGYAFQWFSLAIAWFLLMITAAYKAANTRDDESSQI